MERAELLDILTDASRLYVNYVERQLAQLGIHSGQGSLLSALDILGPCSQKELADFRQVSPATISVMLGRMENRGLVFSSSQIYENVWNEPSYGADNIVAVHIRHIREKIEINPKEPRYIKVIWGHGYKMEKL